MSHVDIPESEPFLQPFIDVFQDIFGSTGAALQDFDDANLRPIGTTSGTPGTPGPVVQGAIDVFQRVFGPFFKPGTVGATAGESLGKLFDRLGVISIAVSAAAVVLGLAFIVFKIIAFFS